MRAFSPRTCRRAAGLGLSLLVAAAAPAAHAQNIVKDGDFEQAPTVSASYGSDPSNDGPAFDSYWTIQNNVSIDSQNKYVFDGSNSLLLTTDNPPTTDGLTQILATTPGSLYDLSFSANADAQNTFSVLFGGQAVPGSPSSITQHDFPNEVTAGGANPNAAQFTFYSLLVSAASASTDLTFQGSADSAVELDNISVVPHSVPVPEAASSASLGLLLCLGLGGLGITVMRRRKIGAVCLSCLAAATVAGGVHAQTVAAPFQKQLEIVPLATLTSEFPTQMAWGPDKRLYVATAFGDVLSYAYAVKTGTLSDPKIAVPHLAGLGIAFCRKSLYVSTFSGIVKLDDKNGNGVWGETAAGELNVQIVSGIPVGDHDVDQMQIRGTTLYIGLGRRTLNGHSGKYTSAQVDDFGGKGFNYTGGEGNTLGDCAYGGTIGWIKNLDAVPDTPGAANVYSTAAITPALVQADDSPYTTQSDGKLVVHSAGTRNPFGLCLDARGQLWFTNNFDRCQTNGDGTSGFGYFKDMLSSDFSRDDQDQLFHASPGADYGYSDVNWRGKNPMLTPGTPGYHRVLSTTFDNLFNLGPYTLHDPAHPDGLGPCASADGCGFFYSGRLPSSLFGNIFITRWNDAVTEAPSSGILHTLRFSDVVAVNPVTGKVQRVVSGFVHPIAVLSDGGDRLLIADFNAGTGGGVIYALHTLPKHR